MSQEREIHVWHPIEDIRSLAENMSRAFEAVPRGGRRLPGYRAPERKLSVVEDTGGFVVTVELPEVSRKDLHISVAETAVTIFARWSQERKAAARKDGRSERVEQLYSRIVQLPAPGRPDEARASFRDRVLKIRIPRAAPSKVRRVKVN